MFVVGQGARVARWTSSATGFAASRCRCRLGRGTSTRTSCPARTAGRSWTPASASPTRRRPGPRSSSRQAGVSRPSSSRTSTPITSARPPISTSSPARPSSRARSTTRSASSCGETRRGRSGSSTGSGSTARPTTSRPSSPARAPCTGRSSATSETRSSSRRASTSTAGSSSPRPATRTGSSASCATACWSPRITSSGRITPTVGLWPASRPDPLGDYLAALDRTIELAPRIALPGHGEPIEDPAGRARELKEHHRLRLEEAVAALTPEPQTGYELSFALFGADLPAAGTPLRGRRDAVASRASRPRGRGSSAGGRRSGYLYCRLIIVGDDFPPSTCAPDGA